MSLKGRNTHLFLFPYLRFELKIFCDKLQETHLPTLVGLVEEPL